MIANTYTGFTLSLSMFVFRIDSEIPRTFPEAALHPSRPNRRSTRHKKSGNRFRNLQLETEQRKLGFATRFISLLQNPEISTGARNAFNDRNDRTGSGRPNPKPADRIVRSSEVEKSSEIFLLFVNLSNSLRHQHDRRCHFRVRQKQQHSCSVEQNPVIKPNIVKNL